VSTRLPFEISQGRGQIRRKRVTKVFEKLRERAVGCFVPAAEDMHVIVALVSAPPMTQ
jgi:hypothetical protein